MCLSLAGVLGSFSGLGYKGGLASILFSIHPCLAPLRSNCLPPGLPSLGRNGTMSLMFHSNHSESGSSLWTPVVQGWAVQLICDGKGQHSSQQPLGPFYHVLPEFVDSSETQESSPW